MFSGAIKANPDTTDWDTSSINNMDSVFRGAINAYPNTSSWDTSSVTNMNSMFRGAISANPNTTNWNTSMVNSMIGMFNGAVSANPDTSNWDITSVTDMFNMFFGVTLPSENYDAILIGFEAQAVQNGVRFNGGNNTACSSEGHAARNNLINVDNWIISDAGECTTIGLIFKNSFEQIE